VGDYKTSTVTTNASTLGSMARHHGQWSLSKSDLTDTIKDVIMRLQKERPAHTKKATQFRADDLVRLRQALIPRLAQGDFRALQVLTVVSLAYHHASRASNWGDNNGLLRDFTLFPHSSKSPAGVGVATVLDKNQTHTLDPYHNAIFSTGVPWDAYDCLRVYLPRMRHLTPHKDAIAFPS
jgi:hypothetical protein